MRVVMVTGGCGFIGSNFIRYLLETDPEISVVNFDCLTYAGNLDNLTDVADDPRYRFIRGDITDRRAVLQLVESGLSAIINFAAESHVDRSIHDAGPFVRTNVLGTQILLDAAREFSVPRFVQISTDEVYGSLGPTGYFTEETPLSPNSPYSASKAAADMLVKSYVHTFGVPAVITRCSNNYGPYQFPEKLLPLFIMNLLRDELVPVYGDGLNVRDWIHVRDHCVRDRPGHDRRYAMDSSKIERELGWQARIPFEEGLRETIRWYENHPDWVANIRTGAYLKYYEKQYGRRLPGANSRIKETRANAKEVNARAPKIKPGRSEAKQQQRTRGHRLAPAKKGSRKR